MSRIPPAALAKIKALPKPAIDELRRRLRNESWRRGDISFKFHETQRRIYQALSSTTERQFFLLCSRRLGKTYMLLAMGFMACLKGVREKDGTFRGARVLFLAPQARDAAEIATDTAAQLLADCPAELRSKIEYKAQAKEFHFALPGGQTSILRLKGVNAEQADSLRGGATDVVILDEAGQMDNLDYIVKSVVLPMTLTTGGRIFFATTPPVTPDHESKVLYDRLFGLGASVKFTILDAPHIKDAAKAEMLRELGESEALIPDILAGRCLPKTTAALRELFAEFVTDASLRVVPDFDEAAEKEIVKIHQAPEAFDAYVSIDPGFQDRTGILYAYYDFRAGKIVVQDEALLHKPSTNDIAEEVLEAEYRLWSDQKPLLRVSDVEPRLIADLWERHQLGFVSYNRQDALGAINLVRSMIRDRQIVIDPRCQRLIHQLKTAIWNKKATDFERTIDGHADLLAALKILCRHVNPHKRPDGMAPGRGRRPGEFHSPRRRFREEAGQLALLSSTPFGKRVARRRKS
jgi:hypothetical protein